MHGLEREAGSEDDTQLQIVETCSRNMRDLCVSWVHEYPY